MTNPEATETRLVLREAIEDLDGARKLLASRLDALEADEAPAIVEGADAELVAAFRQLDERHQGAVLAFARELAGGR